MKWLIRLFRGLVSFQSSDRSPRWAALRKEWLKEHPECAACGGTDDVTPHHKIPVHVDRSRELDKSNLISLCEKHGCHFAIGHCFDWKAYNPHVWADSNWMFLRVLKRQYKEQD